MTLLALTVGAGVSAETGTTPGAEGKDLAYPQLGSVLSGVAVAATVTPVDSGNDSSPPRQAATAEPFAVPAIDGDSVFVSVFLDGTASSGDSTGAARFLRAAGIDYFHAAPDYLEADVPLNMLGELSQQQGVWRIRQIAETRSNRTGEVVTEGAGAHGAIGWHARGITGEGVKVGIIDSDFTGIQALMGKELPGGIPVRCYTSPGTYSTDHADCGNSSSSHGTPVAEIVADVAPDARLFVGVGKSYGDVRALVDWMIGRGVKVINFSLAAPWDGPGDGTSPYPNSPLHIVDHAVSNDIVWVSAAGNAADGMTWFGSFVDKDKDGRHEWAPGDELQSFKVHRAPGDIYIVIRWDDNWKGAASDLDLHLYDESTGTRIPLSADPQTGKRGQVPLETASYRITQPGSYGLAVTLDPGDEAPDWLHIQAFRGLDLEHYTRHHSIENPAESANPGMLAVGAAQWYNSEEIASYSSRGPTPDGRLKPDIVGTMNGTTATDGSFFSGTSASAPHVAGLAALVRQKYPLFNPAAAVAFIKSKAADRGASGPDNTWGHGFAWLSVDKAKNSTLSISGDTVTEGQTATVSISAQPAPAGPLVVYAYVDAGNVPGISGGIRRLTIPTSGSLTLEFPTRDDETHRLDGEFEVWLVKRPHYTVPSNSKVTIGVRDNDAQTLDITAVSSHITLGQTAQFKIVASPPPSQPTSIYALVKQTGELGVSGGVRTVLMPDSGQVVLELPTTASNRPDTKGSIKVTLVPVGPYQTFINQVASVTVSASGGAPDYTDYQTVVDYLIQVRDNPQNTAVKGNPVHIRKWNQVLAAIGYDSGESPMAESVIHANAAKWPDSPFKAASVYLKSQQNRS
ncbi:MAG: S8 family serine peptidase [bacterium]|nr:S8 family serine peptidase [bacterium]MDE0288508.1 S8 family serine peptidase [bacterium]MDE0439258.1 S8 family serine peptidase [bacterium]